MSFEDKEYKVFDMFKNKWALVTAGNLEHFNCCTVGWGSLGTLWTRGKQGHIVTVYIHPGRYTLQFLKEFDTFTVSFFEEEYKKDLAYLGTHSGRDENKIEKTSLTPISLDDSVSFKEAKMTITCKKVYQGQFQKEGLDQEIQNYYQKNPKVYPVDEKGEWQPHFEFIGEIINIYD